MHDFPKKNGKFLSGTPDFVMVLYAPGDIFISYNVIQLGIRLRFCYLYGNTAMTEKELHKLKRQDLLQLLLSQSVEVRRQQDAIGRLEEESSQLRASLERLTAQLDERDAQLEKLKRRLDEKDAMILNLQADREQPETPVDPRIVSPDLSLQLRAIFERAERDIAQCIGAAPAAPAQGDAQEEPGPAPDGPSAPPEEPEPLPDVSETPDDAADEAPEDAPDEKPSAPILTVSTPTFTRAPGLDGANKVASRVGSLWHQKIWKSRR